MSWSRDDQATGRRGYHHGNLREALIRAALDLIAEKGPAGFTFADAAPTSNALQIPELPDYAIVDVNTGQVIEAGFFDEEWRL